MTSKRCFWICLLLFHLIAEEGLSQSSALTTQLLKAEKSLIQHPESYVFYQNLHELVANKHNSTTFEAREHLRDVLEKYGKWSSETTYAKNENGQRIVINCHLKNEKGEPIAHAKIHVFQTDSQGFYSVTDSATKKMGEHDARLFAFVQSDANGNIEINTIRPASYPRKYQGKTIPQHIHFNISAAGYQDKMIQMVFQDDPVMDDYWQKWAKEFDYPVVKLSYLKDKTVGAFEVLLRK